MSFSTSAIQFGADSVCWRKKNSVSRVCPNSQMPGCLMMTITMRDRSKNRKPLQKGRNMSIEAIQTVQALKRACNQSESSLERVFETNFRRLLKLDMISVLCELLRQNQCLLALKVFEDIRKEDWYVPQLSLYVKIVAVLGSNGLLEDIRLLITELKAEILEPDLEAFNALLENLVDFNLTGQAMECFHLMTSLSCDPDRSSFKILVSGLKSRGEMNHLAIVEQEARKYYGNSFNFLENSEVHLSS